MCLVGYKTVPGDSVEFVPRASNNVIFAYIIRESQKPVELYEIIELMMPGAKKIEFFARNHNLRNGWFSLGNELGEAYEKVDQQITYDECGKSILIGETRFKARGRPNCYRCEECLKDLPEGKREGEYFRITNAAMKDQIQSMK
jgi:hypothetical protein